MAVCGMCCIDLNNSTLKILGTHFSYNEKLKEEKNIYNLTLEGKIVIFKTIVIANIVPAIYKNCPKNIL